MNSRVYIGICDGMRLHGARGEGSPRANDCARILQNPRRGAGLGMMLVGKGGPADEVGRASPCSSGFLQLGSGGGGGDVRG